MKAEEVREEQRQLWSKAAPGWVRRQREGSPTVNIVTDGLIGMARIKRGDRVLDLACGAANPSLPIAERVGPSGSVLGLDVSGDMLQGARQLAEEAGLGNVEFRQIQSELDLGVEPESFDAATCRFGLMFMPDKVGAVRQIWQALRPGGRIAFSTFGPRELAPSFTVLQDIVSHHIQTGNRPESPDPFTLPTCEATDQILRDAGFAGVECVPVEVTPISAETPEQYWDIASYSNGLLVAVLEDASEETRQAIRDEAVRTLRAIFPTGPVALTSQGLISSGAKLLSTTANS